MSNQPNIVLLMGVAGSGKTTIGRLLAEKFGWPYFEADDFHSAANKEKMGNGIPLNDTDRAPWLAAIRRKIDECAVQQQSAVFTCSALKEKYRETLMKNAPTVKLVYLSGPASLLQSRLDGRQAHYMKANMLESQLAALETPTNALKIEIDQSPDKMVAEICTGCGLAD